MKQNKKSFQKGLLTLEEIAEIMGITSTRVRQILTKALDKMEREFRRRKLDQEDL